MTTMFLLLICGGEKCKFVPFDFLVKVYSWFYIAPYHSLAHSINSLGMHAGETSIFPSINKSPNRH